MSDNISRFIAASLCIGFLVYGVGAFAVSQGDSPGEVNIRTSMNLLGLTLSEQTGGGYIHWEITGETAREIRQNILMMESYNRYGESVITPEMVYSALPRGRQDGYVKDVERHIQDGYRTYMGSTIYGAKPIDRDGREGWINDIRGLVDTTADSTDPIYISFQISADNNERQQEIGLVNNIFLEALFAPFPDGGFVGYNAGQIINCYRVVGVGYCIGKRYIIWDII